MQGPKCVFRLKFNQNNNFKFLKTLTMEFHLIYRLIQVEIHVQHLYVQKYLYSTYTNFQRMYTIVHIKCTQLINDCTQFYTFNVYNFSIIVQNCVYTMYKNFQRISIILSIQCSHFSKNVLNFFYLMYTNFQRLYISLYIQCT